jgi:hypothetical protein
MIKTATFDDVPVVFELFKKSLAASVFAGTKVDKPEAMRTIRYCIGNNLSTCLLYCENETENATGALLGSAVHTLWYSSKRTASDLFIYYPTVESGRELVGEFTQWAWSIKAVTEIRMVRASNYEALLEHDTVFEGGGLVNSGSMYTGLREQ